MLENISRAKSLSSFVISAKALWPTFTLPLSSNTASSSPLCNCPLAILKLLQSHMLILATVGLKFTLSLCELFKAIINPHTRLSLSIGHEVQASYGQKNQGGKDLASFSPLYISWVTREATSIKNSHSSVTQEINQMLNRTTLPGWSPHQVSRSWHCGHQYL